MPEYYSGNRSLPILSTSFFTFEVMLSEILNVYIYGSVVVLTVTDVSSYPVATVLWIDVS